MDVFSIDLDFLVQSEESAWLLVIGGMFIVAAIYDGFSGVFRRQE